MSTHYTSIINAMYWSDMTFKYAQCQQLPAQDSSPCLLCFFFHLSLALAHNPVCSITLVFLFLYDLISACWRECNSKGSDESARLQFWEPEVRITLKGGGRQGQKENKQLWKASSERYAACLTLSLGNEF